MSQVFDLKRGCWIYYTLSPREAVIAAHQQYDRGNFNTWEYSRAKSDPLHHKTITREVAYPTTSPDSTTKIHMVSCGNFSCFYTGDIDKPTPQDNELPRCD